MKILSEDSRIIDELFDHLDMEGFDGIEKKELKRDDSLDERPMGGLESYLSMGANAMSIMVFLIPYVKQNYPDWNIIFKPLVSNKYETTLEKYEQMSDNSKKAVHENFDVVIKKK